MLKRCSLSKQDRLLRHAGALRLTDNITQGRHMLAPARSVVTAMLDMYGMQKIAVRVTSSSTAVFNINMLQEGLARHATDTCLQFAWDARISITMSKTWHAQQTSKQQWLVPEMHTWLSLPLQQHACIRVQDLERGLSTCNVVERKEGQAHMSTPQMTSTAPRANAPA